MLPSSRLPPRSPVRYIRPPPSPPYGSATNRSPVSAPRFRYPRANPAPPIYNSPITPTGTGSRFSSRMYIRTFAIGRPIGTELSRLEILWLADHTVVSVGPYMLQAAELPS